jgi:hypothetical protein
LFPGFLFEFFLRFSISFLSSSFTSCTELFH